MPPKIQTVEMADIGGMIDEKVDLVNHPPHYTSGGIETIDYMEAKATPEEFIGHLRLTALKYISRFGKKDDSLEDMKKGRWYLDRLIKTLEKSMPRIHNEKS